MAEKASTTPSGTPNGAAQNHWRTDLYENGSCPSYPPPPPVTGARNLAERVRKRTRERRRFEPASRADVYTPLTGGDQSGNDAIHEPASFPAFEMTPLTSHQSKLIDTLIKHHERQNNPVSASFAYIALVKGDWKIVDAIKHLNTLKDGLNINVLLPALWKHYHATTPGFTDPTAPSASDISHIATVCGIDNLELCAQLWHICAGSSALAAEFFALGRMAIWAVMHDSKKGDVKVKTIIREMEKFTEAVWGESGESSCACGGHT